MSATPGPLKARKVSDQEWHVDAPNGHPYLHPQWQSLAIFNGCWDDPVLGSEVAESNARLFAAAPKLLVAARLVLKAHVCETSVHGEGCFVCNQLECAIAEAGELAEAVK